MWGVFPLNLNRQPGHRRVYLARLAGLLLALTLLVQGAGHFIICGAFSLFLKPHRQSGSCSRWKAQAANRP